MRETRLSGLEGGAGFNPRFLPLSRNLARLSLLEGDFKFF